MQHHSELYQRALRFLGRRDHARLELQRKLLRHGLRAEVDEVLDELEKKGLLDDELTAVKRALSRRRRRLWGNLLITQDLKRLGIDATMIQRVLEQVEEERREAESLDVAIGLWIEKAGTPQTVSQLKKLYHRCLRLGYPTALVRKHLQTYFESVHWDDLTDGSE